MIDGRAVFRDPGGDLLVDQAGGWLCTHEAPADPRRLETGKLAFVRCPDCLTLWVTYGMDGRMWAKPVIVGNPGV